MEFYYQEQVNTGSSVHVSAYRTGLLRGRLSTEIRFKRSKGQMTINHLYQANELELCFVRDRSSLKIFIFFNFELSFLHELTVDSQATMPCTFYSDFVKL